MVKAKIDKRLKLKTTDKRYKNLSPEQVAIFKANEIPASTVRYRIKKGWDVERAITEKPKTRNNNNEGDLGMYGTKNKGKDRHFRINKDLDSRLDEIVANSGSNHSDFIAAIVTEWLEKNKSLSS